jgi:ribosomal protein S18 acetylase RimI-like enzyme
MAVSPRSPDVAVRPAAASEAGALGPIFTAARTGLGFLPVLHKPEEDVEYFGSAVGRDQVLVIDRDGRVAGFAVLTSTRLEHLYVHPDHQGEGLGTELFRAALQAKPDGFDLWVFEDNHRARSFYEHLGCREVERTDGSANEEHLPDIRLESPRRCERAGG